MLEDLGIVSTFVLLNSSPLVGEGRERVKCLRNHATNLLIEIFLILVKIIKNIEFNN